MGGVTNGLTEEAPGFKLGMAAILTLGHANWEGEELGRKLDSHELGMM